MKCANRLRRSKQMRIADLLKRKVSESSGCGRYKRLCLEAGLQSLIMEYLQRTDWLIVL